MIQLLTYLKSYKKIAGVIGVVAALGSLYAVYDNIRDGWYEQGVTDTQRAYETKMLELQQEYNVKLEHELAKYREEMNSRHAAEIERIKADKVIEVEIKEVIEYVDREIEVPVECDTVPIDFSRLFNESIRKVNGISTPEINRELLDVPISKSLLVPCTEAYPLNEFNPEDTLKKLYQNLIYNLGQVRKCYRKDEALIKEVTEKEERLIEDSRQD